MNTLRTLRRHAFRAAIALTALVALPGQAAQNAPPAGPSAPAARWTGAAPALPDVPVLDQNGNRRMFHRDLVKGRTVAVNFIFTSCTSICSPLTATFKAVQADLTKRKDADVHLISISVDPLTDTPETLKKYAARFDAGPGWTFVTGPRASIDAIMKAFGVFGGSPDDHTPMVFVGNDATGRWTRAYGLAAPDSITQRIASVRADAPAPRTESVPAAGRLAAGIGAGVLPRAAPPAPGTRDASGFMPVQFAAPPGGNGNGGGARLPPPQSLPPASAPMQGPNGAGNGASYFTNLPLMTQDGKQVRFYRDLIQDRVVLINAFFANCKEICSPVMFNLSRAQALLAKNVKSPVQIISISVDPVTDVPELLRDYARRHDAKPGWSFVTGKKENVDWVLYKLGLHVEDKEEHTAVLWIGNDRSGQWVKMHALSPPEAIVAAVKRVMGEGGGAPSRS